MHMQHMKVRSLMTSSTLFLLVLIRCSTDCPKNRQS
uniref:Uncharacterized protein n=1 Tax=Lepeophtheirus salmonis TaxID=72036 RepID=A0A0K2TTN5_LEPSM